MASLGNILTINSLIMGSVLSARDLFLYPVKLGSSAGCGSLQKKVDQLKEKMGVDIPITVAVNDSFPWAAHGCSVYGRAGITVPSTGVLYSPDTQIAILTHEISHIKHNDGAWMLVAALVTFAVSTVFLWYTLPAALVTYVEWIAMIPTLAAFFIRSVRQEKAADREACKYLTTSQKKAFCDFFDRLLKAKIKYRNEKGLSGFSRAWRHLTIDKNGESLLGRLTHPTMTSRIQFFRSQMNVHAGRQPNAAETHLGMAV